MRYAVILFTARTQTISFYQVFKSYGAYCALINTPQSLRANCGLAIKCELENVDIAKQILKRRSFEYFNGIYLIHFENGREVAQKIV